MRASKKTTRQKKTAKKIPAKKKAVKKAPAKKKTTSRKSTAKKTARKKTAAKKKASRTTTRRKKAESNPVGRPAMYPDAASMQTVIDAYFRECDEHTEDVILKEGILPKVNIPSPYSIEGICGKLGLSPQALCRYENKPEFVDTLSRARARVRNDLATRGLRGKNNPHITKFLMVSMDRSYYGDKQTIIHKDETDSPPLDLSPLTDKELAVMEKLLEKCQPKGGAVEE